ncbi:MAG: MarC family protein [Ignavibacteriaceae bacterium]
MTDNLLLFALTVFTGFFAIMNPIANTPVFLGLAGDRDKSDRKKIAKTSCVTAFIIVVFFVILGKYIFELFGITIPAFKITGGLLLFYVGFEMLQSKKSKIHHQENVEPDDGVAVSPLAIPILAGPGTIVTAMNNVTHGSFIHIAIDIIIFAIMILLTYLAFTLSDLIVKKIGENLITVIGKIMGLILAIMGTQMAIEGVKIAFGIK